jgi:hypothetical protein
MIFEFVYGKTEAELHGRVTEKLMEGWHLVGDARAVYPSEDSGSNQPRFIYFEQTIGKDELVFHQGNLAE